MYKFQEFIFYKKQKCSKFYEILKGFTNNTIFAYLNSKINRINKLSNVTLLITQLSIFLIFFF